MKSQNQKRRVGTFHVPTLSIAINRVGTRTCPPYSIISPRPQAGEGLGVRVDV
ncbi:MAG: hypothetical protein KKH12_14490 [Gammaproteobacteria bacterium]|nr:hypothetical protein [Gammaproteobacteria bacterium]MBU1482868.1 hypothetical protein [Gammaproteobacteria bacterium]